MNVSRRAMLLGTASAALVGSAMAPDSASAAIKVGSDPDGGALVLRMVRVMYPHARFTDGPYERTRDAVLAAANETPGQALMFSSGLAEMKAAGFGALQRP